MCVPRGPYDDGGRVGPHLKFFSLLVEISVKRLGRMPADHEERG